MAFLLGEVSPEHPVHDPQAGTGRDFPHSMERGRGGSSQVVPAQTRRHTAGADSHWGIIWYFQSIR